MAHVGGSRQYRSIVRCLQQSLNQEQLLVNQLHGNLFDAAYLFKPTIALFPALEYTQEVHNFIAQANNVKIFLYVDIEIPQKELVDFWNANCKCIVKNNTEKSITNKLSFDHIYDDNVFTNLNMKRNNKIAVSLSGDMDKNHKILDGSLYPNFKDKPIVLFNNPQFEHPQNIGIYNEPDLNYVLNTYELFVDIDNEFNIETNVCGIPKLDIQVNLLESIQNNRILPTIPAENLEEYKSSNFVNQKLLSYMGINI